MYPGSKLLPWRGKETDDSQGSGVCNLGWEKTIPVLVQGTEITRDSAWLCWILLSPSVSSCNTSYLNLALNLMEPVACKEL